MVLTMCQDWRGALRMGEAGRVRVSKLFSYPVLQRHLRSACDHILNTPIAGVPSKKRTIEAL